MTNAVGATRILVAGGAGVGVSNVDNLPELSIEEIATIMQILLEPTHIPRRTNGYLSSITRPSQARP